MKKNLIPNGLKLTINDITLMQCIYIIIIYYLYIIYIIYNIYIIECF